MGSAVPFTTMAVPFATNSTSDRMTTERKEKMAVKAAMGYGNSAAEELCDWKEERLDCMKSLLPICRALISSMEGCLRSGKVPEFILSQTGCAAILMLMLLLDLAQFPLLLNLSLTLRITTRGLSSIRCAWEMLFLPHALTIRTATLRRKMALSMRMRTPAASIPACLAIPAGSKKYRQAVAVAATVNMLNTCRQAGATHSVSGSQAVDCMQSGHRL